MVKLRKKVEMEEISAASMSDIAFLLLVFFMVTAVFFVKEGLNIQLPRKNVPPTQVLRSNVFEINVSGDTVSMRNVSVGTKYYKSLKEFREELNQLEIQDISTKLAIISTSGETKYGNMLDALSAVQLKGFTQVSVRKKK
ncbi:MAG TPA: biopolymer transporter ExbD [Leptospiraceae bacterium]|nr:biopolymer transporter ExbD [Leptospiraceae bacterium]HMW07419.1 biopolymer transporter ExbD [Leptospiraceae bacterium]HMX34687.1 biopolymer transporter ExbD [Leptospiraceae bacterium]HMY32998.1 biopolymer transporter ExbD [Leptospiraceae bacterium]HMZ63544.1 biopolymer transporter ExbD [Leptospiraceae bacterium]